MGGPGQTVEYLSQKNYLHRNDLQLANMRATHTPQVSPKMGSLTVWSVAPAVRRRIIMLTCTSIIIHLGIGT